VKARNSVASLKQGLTLRSHRAD